MAYGNLENDQPSDIVSSDGSNLWGDGELA